MSQTYVEEICQQPLVLATLAGRFASHGAELARVRTLMDSGAIGRVVLTGMGGSLHSLYPTHIKFSRQAAIPILLWDSSELVQQAQAVIDERTLLIAVSQSGESAELVRLCHAVARPRVSIAITNSGPSTLADWADIAIRTEAGPERTASTKTYTAGLAALALVSSALLGEDLPARAGAIEQAAAAIGRHLAGWQAMADELVAFLGHEAPITFVGRGGNLASAMMGALLTQEASKLPCQSHSGGQFRHGPMELVREGFRSIVFQSPDPDVATLDRRLVDAVLDRGGRCAWVGAGRTDRERRDGEFVIDIPDCDESCLPLVNIVPIQVMQVPLAIARGFEPAQFLNAAKITTIE